MLVATEPLTTDEAWTSLTTGECRVFVDGTQVWRDVNPATRAFPMATATVGRPWLAPGWKGTSAWATSLRGIAI